MTLDEKKEVVVAAYQKTFDKSLAYRKAGCTSEESSLLDEDDGFQERLDYFLFNERERVYGSLSALAVSADSDAVRLKATLEMGKIIYPSRFIEGYDEELGTRRLGKIEVEHTNDSIDVTAEVLAILAECGVLAPRAQGSSRHKVDELHSARAGAETESVPLAQGS